MKRRFQGGETYWTSNGSAFAGLKENIKNKISNLTVFYQHSLPEYNEAPPVKHPLIITQPGTGAKSLYFSQAHAICISSLSKTEGNNLLMYLTAHMTTAKYVFQHQWQPGDLVMWDNRYTMHKRNSLTDSVNRLMKRTIAVSYSNDPKKYQRR